MGGDRGLIARYERLASLAEREAAAAAAVDTDELLRLIAEREALAALLPAAPPEGARGALERALAAQRITTELLQTNLAQVGGELARVERGRAPLRAYGGAPVRTVDASS